MSDIDLVLTASGVAIRDIGLFAAAVGPGSFTGLRIGLATLKALAATLDRSCIGIPTLHAVARAAGSSTATVALLPAGRGELFAQLLVVSASGLVTEQDEPAHLPLAAILEKYGTLSNLLWAGAGAIAQRIVLQNHAVKHGIEFDSSDSGWRLAPKEENLAQHVGALAYLQQVAHADVPAAMLRALYVRPSDPELKECR